ncbi:putative non-specific serine/threonine protein kinase [Rosa chinensis]|uniref:Putative non-specific serine/threonine protein kinase n=1 Tax=Rosa chinensis TaxID=74649 RepID=A0A2P6PN57_ROSCH|nr:putative non-specific serine/threonine protein kinase [Rosa chinensis]
MNLSVCPDTSRPSNENREVVFEGKDEISSLNKVIIKDETRDATYAYSQVGRGKHAYPIKSFTCTVFVLPFLLSVYICCFHLALAHQKEISISEQVDYLLKQATSVLNLCNMYEGWTPWI